MYNINLLTVTRKAEPQLGVRAEREPVQQEIILRKE